MPDADVVILVGQVGVVHSGVRSQASVGTGVPVKTGNRSFKKNIY